MPPINLNAFAGQTVRIRFQAADASTASLVEAAVDDVRITQQ
jgi:carboxypeptidase T